MSMDHSPAREDLLDFDVHVKALAEILDTVRGDRCFVVGVMGEWGEGKSTFLNLLCTHLLDKGNANAKKYWPVMIPLWKWEKEQDAVYNLTRATTEQGETRPAAWRRRAEKFCEARCDTFSMVLRGLYISDSPEEGSLALKTLGEKIAKDHFLFWSDTELLVKQVTKVIEKRSATGARPIICIDDLDRAEPEGARGLIEQVKLVFEQVPCTFVLALDTHVMRAAVAARFTRLEFSEPDEFARRYLDKFVDLSIPVPPMSVGLAFRFVESLQNTFSMRPLSPAQLFTFLLGVPLNARCIKRLYHTVEFTENVLRQQEASGETEARPGTEVPTVDAAASLRVKRLVLELYYPEVLKLARAAPEDFAALQRGGGIKPFSQRWPEESTKNIAELSEDYRVDKVSKTVREQLDAKADLRRMKLFVWIRDKAPHLFSFLCATPEVGLEGGF